MKYNNIRSATDFTAPLAITGVALLAALTALLMALLRPSVSPAPTGSTTVPSPLEVEEFSRQGCQLELDADGSVNTYCTGERHAN